MESPNIRVWLLAIFSFILLTIAGCSGDDGDDGEDGESVVVGILPASAATSVQIEIDDVEINSAPVVTFTARDNGVPVAGLTTSNVRFNIAKLVPGTMGNPNEWQNYINRERSGAFGSFLQGHYDRVADNLEDLGNGQYRYTFGTDITDPAATVGNISYDPSLTHRVAIQVSGFPPNNPILDFRPDGGPVTLEREIVKTETCNACHNVLGIHGGGRTESKYCVTCHNPGSTDPDTGNTVDYTVMVHKIHRGEDLPSVAFGPNLIDDGGGGDDGTGIYQIIGYGGSVHDYSTVVFPQDIRNCTTCHDGSDPDTPQGDDWKTRLSTNACGSCHDNIDFSKDGSPAGANDPLGHSGGIVSDNSECVTCHAVGRIAGSVEKSHELPVNVAAPRFQFNILEICGTPVPANPGDPEPNCPINPAAITVKFSVTDPTETPATGTHGYDDHYNVVTDPEFGAGASLNLLTGWDSSDYTNVDGSGSRPSRANSLNLSSIKATATDNTDGTFTVDLAALPVTVTSGSGVIGIEGHPRAETVLGSGMFNLSVPVRGATAHFGINGDPLVERRVAVDIVDKCDKCHKQLSLHGNNRADNAQLCVICHNPRGTDISRRDITVSGVPDVSMLDGKREETIDMKVLIHAIHAGEKDNPNTPEVEGHGFREEGIVVYGYGNNSHDYGHVRFPGFLNDCTACHNSGTYELDGKWATPLQNGILPTTVASAPDDSVLTEPAFTAQMLNQDDDLYTTPTAAVCSACHDSDVSKAHMELLGGAMFEVDLGMVNTSFETCSVCHGPGKVSDLNEVHGID